MTASLLDTFRSLDSETKHALADMDHARLLAFAALDIAEQRAGVESLSSEQIVACLEAAGVAVRKLSVTRSLAGAAGYISSRKQGEEVFYRLMTKGRRRIEAILSQEKLSVVRIEKDQPRAARLELKASFARLKGIVRICDPYYGIRSLDALDHVPRKCAVRFLTSKSGESARRFSGALKDFKSERPNVEFRLAGRSAGIHDRYVVTEAVLLILGHGLKDIGGKESFMICLDKTLVPDLIKGTIRSFDQKWAKGSPL